MTKLIILLIAIITLSSACTEQERARQFGGTATTDLAPCEKLVLVTWKNNDLWLLTRPMKESDVAEKYKLQEDSSYGIMEGTVEINEQACT